MAFSFSANLSAVGLGFAGAIPAKVEPRGRLIPFQGRCGGGEALGVIVTPSVARCSKQRS